MSKILNYRLRELAAHQSLIVCFRSLCGGASRVWWYSASLLAVSSMRLLNDSNDQRDELTVRAPSKRAEYYAGSICVYSEATLAR